MKRVQTHDRVRCPDSDDVGDPRSTVRGHELQVGGTIAEQVEEQVHDVFGAAFRGPHDSAGHVVAHDGQIAVALLVLHLVDRHSDQAVEKIDPVEGLGRQPDTHVVDRTPRHSVAVRCRLLVAHDCVVHNEVFERPGEHGVVSRPRNLGNRWATRSAVDPSGDRDDVDGRVAGIKVPPSSGSVALVIPDGQLPAPTASAPPASLRSHMHP